MSNDSRCPASLLLALSTPAAISCGDSPAPHDTVNAVDPSAPAPGLLAPTQSGELSGGGGPSVLPETTIQQATSQQPPTQQARPEAQSPQPEPEPHPVQSEPREASEDPQPDPPEMPAEPEPVESEIPVATKPEPAELAEPIFFGTTLDPAAVMTSARDRAEAQADPSSPRWRATGDQHRTYHFDETGQDEPFRLYVPTEWDGQSELPLVMFLHGAGSNENTYVDQNGGLMLSLAREHGFLLVSAKGAEGAYGNFLRLTAPFGNEQGAAELMAAVTPASERSNELSEKDVINVLEVVLEEYPIDRTAMFLTGHSMGSGGTWYIGGKYAAYWRAIAPMSGPFVQETGYPWDRMHAISILVTEGTQTPSLDASRLLGQWLADNGFDAAYQEVDADHGGMVPLVLPDVFDYFEQARVN